ncbi:MAG: flavin reductase family protein [Verrucomicrobiota bacterium]
MLLDLENDHAAAAYKILASVVTPRPIAWVSTLNQNETVNLAPFSFFNVLGANPPLVGFAPGDKSPGLPKDTALNIRDRKEFVVNLVDEPLAEAMNRSADALAYGESELSACGLHPAPSAGLLTPRVAEAPVALECREWGTLQIGDNRLVLGLVEKVQVREGLFHPETLTLQPNRYYPIGRMQSPASYCRTGDQFEMTRP